MLFIALLFFITPLFSGFMGDTPIKANFHLVPIKQMHIHRNIQSMDVTNLSRTHSYVTGVYRYITSRIVIITLIDGTVITTAPHQQFYDCSTQKWRHATELEPYDRLLCKNNDYAIVQSINQLDALTTLYDITVEPYHNFYVTDHEILTHNAVFAVVAAAPIILGYCVAACALGYIVKKAGLYEISSLYRDKKSKKQKKQQEESYSDLSSPPPPDDPEKFKKEHPHGRYEDAPYHKNHQSGRKSPRPIDGQAALDNSFEISGSTNSRVGVSNKQIVMLRRTLGNVYHGYVVEFDNLMSDIQNILIKQRIVNGRGKFL